MDIFISYSNEDQEEAKKISDKLDARNISNFLAPKKLRISDPFEENIRENLRKCKAVFLLLTPHSLQSEWVTTEWGAAWALGKLIFPILLRCSPSDLPSRLSKLHCKDYYKLDEIIDEYLEIVSNNPPPSFSSVENRGSLLFDIDGTLLDSKDRFDSEKGKAILELIRELVNERYKIVIITGNDINVQYDRILIPCIKNNVAENVFCFSDGGSRAFEFNRDNREYYEYRNYSNQNIIAREQSEIISSTFHSLIPQYIEKNDTLLIPKIDFFRRTLDYLDLRIHPIKPSFRNNKEKFDELCNDIMELCHQKKEFNKATFELFSNQASSSIIIRAHGQEPEADVYKLQGLIFRKLFRLKKYQELSKPELEIRGGEVICQIAIKPFNDGDLRADFRDLIENKLISEGYNDFSILTGGETTIDIQLKGVNKEKAIRFLIEEKGYDPKQMIYFGDEFGKFGNDLPVAKMPNEIRPQIIINVGTDDVPPNYKNRIINDCNGPDGTSNFLKMLLFESQKYIYQ